MTIHAVLSSTLYNKKLNSACLIFGLDVNGGILHVVVGIGEYVHIVTEYRPDDSTFMPDMKTRREK